ncbi:MAG TPA: cupredoxin domain-containing protein, partial [Candidatus Paceibacterota bacterium]|nr:cupredoxin domain-containing protein [Candidatus Paceibacterota bacterium]
MSLGGNKGERANVEGGEQEATESGTETFNPEVPDEDLEVTEPDTETSAAPGSDKSLRVFEMTAGEDGYNIDEMVVNKGDTVSIKLSGGDVEYDIALPDMGLHQTVAPGEEKKLEFQALTPGTFTYICQSACPGGKNIKGSLIVKDN